MWCTRCRQHVAAIVGDSDEGAICANCGNEVDAFADLLGDRPAQAVAPQRQAAGNEPSQTTAHVELPQLAHSRARLDQIGRRLDALGKLASTAKVENRSALVRRRRWDAALLRTWVARVGLFSGLTLFSCGIALAGWSLVGDQVLLWNVGLPTALVGQFLLLVALASQWNLHSQRVAQPAGSVVPRPARRSDSRFPV